MEDAHRLSDRSAVPPELDVAHPSGGAVPAGRGARKRDQLLNVFLFVAPFLRRKPDAVVVDFGCGGGHQSLPLAYHFPDARFVLVDAKRRSLDVARRRADAAGLANVRVVEGRIEDFDEPFDVGIALHACGAASDFAMEKCVAARAAYVVAPCCVGKISLAVRTEDVREDGAEDDGGDGEGERAGGRVRRDDGEGSKPLRYPRSHAAASAVSTSSYVAVAKAADFGGEGYDETARGAVGGGTTDADTRTAARRRKTPRRTRARGGARARAHRRGDEDRFESVGRGVAASVAGFAGPDGETRGEEGGESRRQTARDARATRRARAATPRV